MNMGSMYCNREKFKFRGKLEILKQLTFSEMKAFIISEDAGTMIC